MVPINGEESRPRSRKPGHEQAREMGERVLQCSELSVFCLRLRAALRDLARSAGLEAKLTEWLDDLRLS